MVSTSSHLKSKIGHTSDVQPLLPTSHHISSVITLHETYAFIMYIQTYRSDVGTRTGECGIHHHHLTVRHLVNWSEDTHNVTNDCNCDSSFHHAASTDDSADIKRSPFDLFKVAVND